MIYQKLLMGKKPYYINAEKLVGFPEHKHPELEFVLCRSHSIDSFVEGEEYKINVGELQIIGSMVAHTHPSDQKPKADTLIIEIGPTFLGEDFEFFSKAFPKTKVVSLKDEKYSELYNLLIETGEVFRSGTELSDMIVKGNIYKICAYIYRFFAEHDMREENTAHALAVHRIEKSLVYIREHFNEKISLEKVADLTGYSKSNFCKIFKQITGDTFHNLLNKYRVDKAMEVLLYTSMPIETVATEIGFTDAKSFCRVFKNITGNTPGEVRKNHLKKER